MVKYIHFLMITLISCSVFANINDQLNHQLNFIDGSPVQSKYVDHFYLGEDLYASTIEAADSLDSSRGQSERCSTIDYRPQHPLKIRNQKDISWCFAHASADNLQIAEKTSVQISAADIAINYQKSSMSRFSNLLMNLKNKDQNAPPEYGWAKIASNMILEQGYCPEDNLPSDDWVKIVGEKSIRIQIYDAIKDIYSLRESVQNNPAKYSSSEDLPFYYKFKTIDRSVFFNILKQSKNKVQVLENLRVSACNGYRKSFTQTIRPRMIFNLIGMMNALDNALESGKPVSIDFSYSILNNVDDTGINLFDLHTTPVFGRKFDAQSNQCLYLIKDSYSEICPKDYDKRIQCSGGYLWLPRKNLRKSATSIVIYDK